MQLFVIRCWFQHKEESVPVNGLAICSDANTPVTFIYPDGTPLTAVDIWDYRLRHNYPWSQFEDVQC